jgi:hypothetical protein
VLVAPTGIHPFSSNYVYKLESWTNFGRLQEAQTIRWKKKSIYVAPKT